MEITNNLHKITFNMVSDNLLFRKASTFFFVFFHLVVNGETLSSDADFEASEWEC
jgi:hypothetical protein